MTEPDRFADWDAAYVLGALTVPQRHAFEDHLADCADCRTAVSELAAMPGLLSQLPAAEAVALNEERLLDDHDQQAGDRGLPESIRRMSPPRGRSLPGRLLLVAVVVIALIIGGVGGYLIRDTIAGPPAPAPSVTLPNDVRLAFAPVRPSTMIAVADLTGTGSGTKINIECQYANTAGYGSTGRYALYVVDQNGDRTRGTSWPAAPGERVRTSMTSTLSLSEINSLEIDDVGTGQTIMRAIV
ncbi:hypothetical protein FOE78_08375 [Microlunatus elymi]|uniref:Putative zinc-finger domain-containing protein n=1 Tax=Microlunatus elymi TaxID=2596828 RepID=A0A516PXL0_9ACTN|nr:zf-HC2 domain-containing protein [Microlunatus elymi]QDP95910.1 hypothetical protein FOE78_08375 [Microlunatus elymi]